MKNSEGVKGKWGRKEVAEGFSLQKWNIEIKSEPHTCSSKPSITIKKIIVTQMTVPIYI